MKNLVNNEITDEIMDAPKEFHKAYSMVKHKGESKSKRETCMLCDSQQNSFVKSHTIPAFILNSIAVEGKVFPARAIITKHRQRLAEGIGRVNTFRTICESCEHIFLDYENPEGYSGRPSGIMLNQIALKTYLSRYSFKNVQLGEFSAIVEQTGSNDSIQSSISNTGLDAFDFNREFEYAKSAVKKRDDRKYYLQWYCELDYAVPIAFQEAIAVGVGFGRERINDLNNTSKKYKIQNLHICIFPLREKSVVFCFTKSDENRYRNFFRRFNTLETNMQLQVILFLALAYSDRVYLSPAIIDKAVVDSSLCNAVGLTSRFGLNADDLPIDAQELESELFQKFSCDNASGITNLLSGEYALDIR